MMDCIYCGNPVIGVRSICTTCDEKVKNAREPYVKGIENAKNDHARRLSGLKRDLAQATQRVIEDLQKASK